MGDLPNPRMVISGLLALIVAIEVGIPLSNARNTAIAPLVGGCPSVILGEATLSQFILCGTGVVILLSIPGIGVGLIVYRAR